MKSRFGFFCGILGVVALWAAEPGDEILAYWKNSPVTRAEAALELSAEERVSAPAGAPEVWKKAVTAVVCRRALLALLATEKMQPEEAATRRFLTELYRLMPDNNAALLEEIPAASRRKDLQLSVAVYQFLARKMPEKIRVSDQETAAFYHAGPQRFIHREKIVYGFLKFTGSVPDAEKKAWEIRARLLQGGNFDDIALRINPQGPGELPPELAEILAKVFAKPQKYAVTDPVVIRNAVYLVQIRAYEPQRLCTLEECQPYIRLKLAFDRVSVFMKNYLRETLAREPIRYQNVLRLL